MGMRNNLTYSVRNYCMTCAIGHVLEKYFPMPDSVTAEKISV
jgi:hypothetical protein